MEQGSSRRILGNSWCHRKSLPVHGRSNPEIMRSKTLWPMRARSSVEAAALVFETISPTVEPMPVSQPKIWDTSKCSDLKNSLIVIEGATQGGGAGKLGRRQWGKREKPRDERVPCLRRIQPTEIPLQLEFFPKFRLASRPLLSVDCEVGKGRIRVHDRVPHCCKDHPYSRTNQMRIRSQLPIMDVRFNSALEATCTKDTTISKKSWASVEWGLAPTWDWCRKFAKRGKYIGYIQDKALTRHPASELDGGNNCWGQSPHGKVCSSSQKHDSLGQTPIHPPIDPGFVRIIIERWRISEISKSPQFAGSSNDKYPSAWTPLPPRASRMEDVIFQYEPSKVTLTGIGSSAEKWSLQTQAPARIKAESEIPPKGITYHFKKAGGGPNGFSSDHMFGKGRMGITIQSQMRAIDGSW
ncbi:hypothetical protein K438DRAFT_1780671 [Mycena galopus ATCC 62051]|nr:hypothetical protein K438DRAFT_1780671 [Mycena galopus ATCC 62051]